MNTHHARFTRVILALLAGIAASLVWGTASAQFTRGIGTLIVPIAGTVEGAPETIALSGQARVVGTLVLDPDFGGPASVILSIDLLNVTGVGQSTRTRYIATGQENLLRLFRTSDLVEFTFPVSPVGARGIASVRPAAASFALSFDTGNGQMLSAMAHFAAPDLPGLAPGRP